MATDYTSKKLSLHVAEQFAESFSEPEPTSVGYVFIGKHTPYSDENVVSQIVQTIQTENQIWKNMYAAKRIVGSDTNLVIRTKPWQISTKFAQYDDQAETYTSSDNFYVVTPQNKVYKCVHNNRDAFTTTNPAGYPTVDYTINNGVQTTEDGYIWKYMYAIDSTNKFIGESFIPVPTTVDQVGYYTSSSSVVDGAIYSIKLINSGINYNTAVTSATLNSNGTNRIKVSSTSNIVVNMAVSGSGIIEDSYVTAVDVPNSNVTISKNTTTTVIGTSLTFSPRVQIIGDGTDARANLTLAANGSISDIKMVNFGSGYSLANVAIYGTGTGANARAILSPKFGHGKYPAKELSANSVMIVKKIGEVDTTEGGVISSSTTIRQYGFLRDPFLYGKTTSANSISAPVMASQLYKVTVVAGTSYTIDELVYQGSLSSPTFSGYVNSQTANTISLSQVTGTFTIGSQVVGNTSLVSRSAVSINYPAFEPYTGDILYAENISKLQRTSGQTENFRFVISF